MKEKWRSPDGWIYNFSEPGGIANCSDCDDNSFVNMYNREDGLELHFCKACEDKLQL